MLSRISLTLEDADFSAQSPSKALDTPEPTFNKPRRVEQDCTTEKLSRALATNLRLGIVWSVQGSESRSPLRGHA